MPDSEKFIDFHKPCTGEAEIAAVAECLRSGWLTTGPKTKRFESEFAAYIGVKHAVAVNSCTAALHLALETTGIKEGDLVLVPTMTFAATAEVVRYFNAIPVLVDCREDDLCMDMDHAEKILDDLAAGRPVRGVPEKHGVVRAVMPVHFGGEAADIVRCRALCERHGLREIDDCAHCCPSYYTEADGKKTMTGSKADISCFSFYANKTIATGEGGMALTDNEDWANRMRVMSLHGISRDAWKRFTRAGTWRYEIKAPGFKYNMPDTAAAIGLEQLKRGDEFWAARKKITSAHSKLLAGIPGVTTPPDDPSREGSKHLYIIKIDEKTAGVSRDVFIEKMKERGVGTSVHYIPLHMHPYYIETYGFRNDDFPVASGLSERIVSLPVYPGMTDDMVERVARTAREIITGAK